MGGFEVGTPVPMEPTLKYHPGHVGVLTPTRNPGGETRQRVSLTGAVSSKKVTEEREGPLSTVGNRAQSVWVEGGLTARQTSRAGAKAGPNDPVVACGSAIAQRTKGTPGITG